MSVRFGPIGRGSMPHVYNFQNVFFKYIGSNPRTSFNCNVEHALEVGKWKGLKTTKLDEKYTRINFESNDSMQYFTCSVNSFDYTQTYKYNEKLLFRCYYEPDNFKIKYKNMNPTVVKWCFVDN